MELFWSQSEDPTSLNSSKSLGRVYTYILSKLLCQILEFNHSQISMCQNLDAKEQTVHCLIVVITCKCISNGAQYVTLDNKIKCLSLAAFFSATPPIVVTGTAYMWELLIANHLAQSLWSTNLKYWAKVKFNLLHSFLEVHTN